MGVNFTVWDVDVQRNTLTNVLIVEWSVRVTSPPANNLLSSDGHSKMEVEVRENSRV